jgi:hypothetical protein
MTSTNHRRAIKRKPCKSAEIEVAKILTCSTAHVTRAEARALDDDACPLGMTAWTSEYGWILHIGIFKNDDPEDRAHNKILLNRVGLGFRGAIAVAVEYECDFIRFDRDAPIIGGVPHYSW